MMKITEIANLIKNLKSTLIFCHINPDGDTLSCAFALKYALEKLNIKADIVSPDGVPAKYDKLNLFGETFTEATGKYDGYISVDCVREGQMGEPYNFFAKQRETFNIDHHSSNSRYAKYNYVCDYAANTMNIYELILALGVPIDEYLANTLFIGLITDTGNFAHSNTDTKTFEVAAELSRRGANAVRLYTLLFKSQPLERAKLYLEVMKGMRLFEDGKVAVIVISQAMLKKYGLTKSDTEGFIDFPMSIAGVIVGLSLFENKHEVYKISLRGKEVNVCEIASCFGGGGHEHASGATIAGPVEEVIDKLVVTTKKYI